MSLLLDTHALLWFLAGDERVRPEIRALISAPASDVFVSAASAWEVATKARLGKLSAGPLANDFVDEIQRQGFLPLAITLEHGERAGALPGVHKDPFDRMLVAQAHAENLRLISNEAIFDGYGVVRLW